MKILILFSWICLIIFLKTLPYSSCNFIPKSQNNELILHNENKEKIANDTFLESTSTKSNKDEHKDVHTIIHQRKGAYGGADLLRKRPNRNGANNNYNFGRPIMLFCLLFLLIIAFIF
ncbi:hypothetical protein HAX54_024428 [Datura stramonium]|uniref:Uncharacterized protein n=1 Tax=Datura stramonium TaxID=4076 RepID=A0ABS8V0W2_DATST|nr:hypothetical protein [Datura stramonium]